MVVHNLLLTKIKKMQFKFKILSSKPHGNGSSNISLSEAAFISAHKRNNKEDVTGRNEGIWPCRLVGVPLRGSSLSRFNVWKVKPFKNQLGSLWWSVIDLSTIGCLTKYTLHAGWGCFRQKLYLKLLFVKSYIPQGKKQAFVIWHFFKFIGY